MDLLLPVSVLVPILKRPHPKSASDFLQESAQAFEDQHPASGLFGISHAGRFSDDRKGSETLVIDYHANLGVSMDGGGCSEALMIDRHTSLGDTLEF